MDKAATLKKLRAALQTKWPGMGAKAPAHLAILAEPYLAMVLDGTKTVESRVALNRIAPWLKVAPGHLLFLKRSGGPVVGACMVTQASFYQANVEAMPGEAWWPQAVYEASKAVGVHPSYWDTGNRKGARFCTLMELGPVVKMEWTKVAKRGQAGWLCLGE